MNWQPLCWKEVDLSYLVILGSDSDAMEENVPISAVLVLESVVPGQLIVVYSCLFFVLFVPVCCNLLQVQQITRSMVKNCKILHLNKIPV